MVGKRGQTIFGMSFGAILSMFIIAAIIAVSIFAIRHFFGLSECTHVGFFFRDLQNEIDRAWQSGIYGNEITFRNLPKDSRDADVYVCFGKVSLSQHRIAEDERKKDELKNEYTVYDESNVFVYPPEVACGGDFFQYSLKHARVREDKFFCSNVSDGKATIKIRKESNENSVTLCRDDDPC